MTMLSVVLLVADDDGTAIYLEDNHNRIGGCHSFVLFTYGKKATANDAVTASSY